MATSSGGALSICLYLTIYSCLWHSVKHETGLCKVAQGYVRSSIENCLLSSGIDLIMCKSDSQANRLARIHYSCNFLMNFAGFTQPLTDLDMLLNDCSVVDILRKPRDYYKIKKEKPRKRGSRGGVRRRLKRIPPPLILLCNAQSLRNKADELKARVIHQETFRNACILAFTETWLTPEDLESDLSLPGFGLPIILSFG